MVVGAVNLGAQTPNFTGTWTRIVDPNAPATSGGSAPDAMMIVQDAKTVTMTERMNGNDMKFVYNLDGTDSKKMMTDGSGTQYEIVARAKWAMSTLITTWSRDVNGTSAIATFAYSLDASGHLVAVVTLPPRGGGDPVSRTVSYKKS